MAMSAAGAGKGLENEMNVTPMIDVLLVLLIIFMAALPSMRKAIDIQLPDPNPQSVPANSQSNQIVLEVLPDGTYSINTQKVDDSQLAGRLKEIYDPRPEKIIFIKGDPAAKYQAVIHAMDVARGAGVKVIGIPPKDIPGGAVTPAGGQ
jgi:biopolymer transport protein TolR